MIGREDFQFDVTFTDDRGRESIIASFLFLFNAEEFVKYQCSEHSKYRGCLKVVRKEI